MTSDSDNDKLPERHDAKPMRRNTINPGMKFGRLTTLRMSGRNSSGNMEWDCLCECGTETTVVGSKLINSHTRSCGCLSVEKTITRSSTHHQFGSEEYSIWGKMIQRCRNPKSTSFKDYGGRGIRVCERWEKFENFLADIGKRPSPNHSLDRFPNQNGNYEPGNVRWATDLEQGRNRRNNRILLHENRAQCLSEWAEEVGLPDSAISLRLKRGWSVSDALTKPLRITKLTKA